jgi:hypothetical protein
MQQGGPASAGQLPRRCHACSCESGCCISCSSRRLPCCVSTSRVAGPTARMAFTAGSCSSALPASAWLVAGVRPVNTWRGMCLTTKLVLASGA